MSDKNAENTVEKTDAEADGSATELVDDADQPSVVEGDLADPLAVPIDDGKARMAWIPPRSPRSRRSRTTKTIWCPPAVSTPMRCR